MPASRAGGRVPELWPFLLSASVALCVVGILFLNADTRVTCFTDRVIGPAIARGVNAAVRAPIYLRLFTAFLGSFALAYLACRILERRIASAARTAHIRIERDALTLLSGCAVVSFAALALSWNMSYASVLATEYFGALLILLIIGAKSRGGALRSLAANYSVVVLSLCAPLVFLFAWWVLRDGPFAFGYRHYAYYLLGWAAFFALYRLLLRAAAARGLRRRRLDGALLVASIPLLCVPASVPIANEIQFSISRLTDASPRAVSLVLIALLALLSLALFSVSLARGGGRVRQSALVRRVYFPLALATVFLLVNHLQRLTFAKFDLAHEGEGVLPVQQLFRFGVIPYVDMWLGHGVSDMFYQFVYTCLNGYRGLEMGMWPWLPDLAGVVLIYFLFSLFTTPLLALLFTALLPYQVVIPLYWCPAIVPVLALHRALKRPSLASFSVFWGAVLCIAAYRPSFGSGAFPAAVFAVLLWHAVNGGRLWRRSLAAFLIVAGGAGALYTAVLLARGRSLVQTALLILQYATYDRLEGPLETLFPHWSPLVVWTYLGLPLVSAAYLLLIGFRIARRNPLPPRWHALGFIAVMTLFLSLRGLAQHCLHEEFTPYLSVFLLLSVPLLIPGLRALHRQILFLGALLLYSSAVFDYTGGNLFTFVYRPYLKDPPTGELFRFRHWRNRESRVVILDDRQYRDVVAFLNRHLAPGQTFYEWTQAAMLYLFSDRRTPGMFYLPTDQYAGEVPQRYMIEQLEKLNARGRVPFALLGASKWWGGRPYRLPAWEVMLYRIAEYMYRAYRPLGSVGGFQVWVRRGSGLNLVEGPRRIPLDGDGARTHDMTPRAPGALSFSCGGDDPHVWGFARLGDLPPLDLEHFCWLRIVYRSSAAGRIQVFFGLDGGPFNPGDSRTVPLEGGPGERVREVFVSVPTLPDRNRLTALRLDPPEGSIFEILGLEMSWTRDPLRPAGAVTQRFDLMRLPYVWGTYDPLEAARRTEVLAEPLAEKRTLSPRAPLTLPLEGGLDRSTGNYLHLRIRAEKEAVVTIAYGNGFTSEVSFDVVPSAGTEDYLVRISCQWQWMSEEVRSLTLSSSAPLEIERVLVRKGD